MPTDQETKERNAVCAAIQAYCVNNAPRVFNLRYRLEVDAPETRWRISIILYKDDEHQACRLNMDLPATGSGTGLYVVTSGGHPPYDPGCMDALKYIGQSVSNLTPSNGIWLSPGTVIKHSDVKTGWFVPIKVSRQKGTVDVDLYIDLGKAVIESMIDWANR